MFRRSILIAAQTWFGSTTFGVAQGFRRLGWDVHEVNANEFIPPYRSTILRIARRALRPLCIREYNLAIREKLERFRPEALLTVKGVYMEPETLRIAARAGVRTVNYYPDVYFEHPGLDKATLGHYDHVFTTKSFHLDYLRKLIGDGRVSYLAHGYSTDAHQAPDADTRAYDCDVVYVGLYSDYKAQWLEALLKHLPGISIRIYGHGWNALSRSSSLRECVAGHAVLGAAYCRALWNARISLAIHSGPRRNGDWEDLVSTRTFEIPACKAFMLHVDSPEVRELFRPEAEIGVFDSVDSMCSQVERYLRNDSEREHMIESAWRRCVPAYSYDARANSIASWITTASPA